jgi:hypothetical protein
VLGFQGSHSFNSADYRAVFLRLETAGDLLHTGGEVILNALVVEAVLFGISARKDNLVYLISKGKIGTRSQKKRGMERSR